MKLNEIIVIINRLFQKKYNYTNHMKIVDMKTIMSKYFFLNAGTQQFIRDDKSKEYKFDWRSNIKLKERLKTKSTK